MADIYLDLKSIFDTRLFFEKGEKAHTPLSDYHYPAEIFRGGRAEVGDILFERGAALGDCACCAGQEISVNGFYTGAVALAAYPHGGITKRTSRCATRTAAKGKFARGFPTAAIRSFGAMPRRIKRSTHFSIGSARLCSDRAPAATRSFLSIAARGRPTEKNGSSR